MQQVLMHMLRVQCYMYLYILYNESEMKPQFGTFFAAGLCRCHDSNSYCTLQANLQA